MAAWTAAQATANQLRPGARFEDIQERLSGIADDFGVKYTQGLMTHLVGKNMLAGDEGIIYRPTPDQVKLQDPEATVLPNQVFLVDVVMSNGEYAIARPTSMRTAIYKRSPAVAPLKLKASRAFLNQIGIRHGAMAFALRWFGSEGGSGGDGRRRIALKECLQAELVHSYDVIADYEQDALTARFAFTIITGTDASKPCAILTHPPFDPSRIVTDKRPSSSTVSLLN
jgi:methionine aminopeptidase